MRVEPTVTRRDKNRYVTAVAAPVTGVLVTVDARADGFDVTWFLSRVDGWHTSPARALSLVMVLMTANYVLNAAVIGLPARKSANVASGRIARDLVWFTLVAQVLDRMAAVLGGVVGYGVLTASGVQGDRLLGSTITLTMAVNFMLAGVAVGWLAWKLLARWGVSTVPRWKIAIAAGIITNPAWAMASWLLY